MAQDIESQKFHIALNVKDLAESIQDYSKRLGCEPQVVVPGNYALWRTETLKLLNSVYSR
ncbi:MAG: hypothetical protein ACFBSC_00980 [Microcoleaceae cyanobacterium]